MPNSPSAAKRLRQGNKRRLHNRIAKKVVKTSMKKTLQAVADKNLDKAGARRVLHPNTAARRKSKLAREYAAAVAKAKSS